MVDQVVPQRSVDPARLALGIVATVHVAAVVFSESYRLLPPVLAALNLALGEVLDDLPGLVRTFVLATVAVPIVIYGLMPRLHRARVRILNARA